MTTNANLTTDEPWRMVSMKPVREAKYLDYDNNSYTRMVSIYHRQDSQLPHHKMLEAEWEDSSRAPYPNPYLGIYSNFVQRIIQLIEDHIDDEFYGIEQLCRDAGASRSQLHCKLKTFTGLSTSIFIRVIRLHRAKALLMSTDLNITQVAFEVGFSDSRYFSRVFSKMFHQSPKEFREQALAIVQ